MKTLFTGASERFKQEFPLHNEAMEIINEEMQYKFSPEKLVVKRKLFSTAGAGYEKIVYPYNCLSKDSLETFASVYAHELRHIQTKGSSSSSNPAFYKGVGKYAFFGGYFGTLSQKLHLYQPDSHNIDWGFLLSCTTWLVGVGLSLAGNPYVKQRENDANLASYEVTGVMPSASSLEHLKHIPLNIPFPEIELLEKLKKFLTGYPTKKETDRYVLKKGESSPSPWLLELFEIDKTKHLTGKPKS